MKDEPKEETKTEKLRRIQFCFFLKSLSALEGQLVFLRFKPKNGALDWIEGRVSEIGASMEAEMSSLSRGYTDESFEDPFASIEARLGKTKSKLMRSMRGSCRIYLKLDSSLLASFPITFEQYERIVRLLIDFKASDPGRFKKYLRETRKNAPSDPIFFKMRGIVPSAEILDKIIKESEAATPD